MSLLISRDYANSGTPLWLPTSGGVITGNLVVDGNVVVDGGISATTNVSAPAFVVEDASGNDTGFMRQAGTGAGAGLLFQGDIFKFGKTGTGNVNTTLTTSVFGANTDALAVGGSITCAIGPIPTQIITSTKTVNPIAVSPAAPSQFGVDTTITSISGAEYDVQVTGTVFCVSGIPDPADYIVYEFTCGGSGTLDAIVFPGAAAAGLGGNGVTGLGPLVAAGAAATVTLRGRVVSGASGTTLGADARVFLTGTAVYGATLTVLDVQRVR
jgi:hypothetical protein